MFQCSKSETHGKWKYWRTLFQCVWKAPANLTRIECTNEERRKKENAKMKRYSDRKRTVKNWWEEKEGTNGFCRRSLYKAVVTTEVSAIVIWNLNCFQVKIRQCGLCNCCDFSGIFNLHGKLRQNIDTKNTNFIVWVFKWSQRLIWVHK